MISHQNPPTLASLCPPAVTIFNDGESVSIGVGLQLVVSSAKPASHTAPFADADCPFAARASRLQRASPTRSAHRCHRLGSLRIHPTWGCSPLTYPSVSPIPCHHPCFGALTIQGCSQSGCSHLTCPSVSPIPCHHPCFGAVSQPLLPWMPVPLVHGCSQSICSQGGSPCHAASLVGSRPASGSSVDTHQPQPHPGTLQ
jgi:hypothetical protein